MITREEFEKALDTYRLCRRAGNGLDLRFDLQICVRVGPTVETRNGWEIQVTRSINGEQRTVTVGSVTLDRMNKGAPYYEILVDRCEDRSNPVFAPWRDPTDIDNDPLNQREVISKRRV